MTEYNKILAAIDLTEESNQVLDKAKEMANRYNCKLDVVHIIEPLGYAYGGDIPMDLTEIQQQLEDHAREFLEAAGQKYQIAKDQQHVSIGRPETEIHRMSEDENFDLIVVGSHGRHGIQLLLGSTANGILHGAKCDVLAVRIE